MLKGPFGPLMRLSTIEGGHSEVQPRGKDHCSESPKNAGLHSLTVHFDCFKISAILFENTVISLLFLTIIIFQQ